MLLIIIINTGTGTRKKKLTKRSTHNSLKAQLGPVQESALGVMHVSLITYPEHTPLLPTSLLHLTVIFTST